VEGLRSADNTFALATVEVDLLEARKVLTLTRSQLSGILKSVPSI